MLLGQLFEVARKKHVEGTEENNLEKLQEAALMYKELLNDAPHELQLLFGLGTVEMQLGYNGLAITILQKALQIKKLPEVYNNLGTCFRAEGHYDEARSCWEEALRLRDDADYYNNMTTLYINQGNPDEGMEYALKGLKLDPNHARLHWNYSLLLLEQGRWKEGFEEYDYGLNSMDRPTRMYSQDPEKVPFWDGRKNKRVVVYGEQGMGDEIMFASCIPDLKKDCKEVIFDCHPRMVDLFERSFGIKCYGTRKSEKIDWPNKENLDYKIPVGSLFRFYRSDGVFPKEPYLKPDPELVEFYRKKLRETGEGPYIGVGWHAGTKTTNTKYRSIKLKFFEDMINYTGTFISLQYTAGASDKVERYKQDTGHVIHHWADVVETGSEKENTGYNYDHTVALVSALDLVIVPNTTAVHLCGALGKECWTFTPDACAWRYQFTGEDMPMYGSVRQFRGDNAKEQITAAYRDRWARAEPVAAAGR
jgi:tetratricopeptide (TPR) repeat protein